MQPEGLSQWKLSKTPSGIKPPNFQLVAQWLIELRHRVTRYLTVLFLNVSTPTRWFKYDQDDCCVNKSQFVPVIFEPPCSNAVLTYRDIKQSNLTFSAMQLIKICSISARAQLRGLPGEVSCCCLESHSLQALSTPLTSKKRAFNASKS
jgi:hypothetical protein